VEPYATADQVWQGAMIFARIGAIMLMLPGVGESYVPPRIRLSLALVVSLALWPLISGSLPALPATLGGLAGWIIREVLVGLAIGALLRSFLTVLSTAGEVVALQTTLAFAQHPNPMQAHPGSTLPAVQGRRPRPRAGRLGGLTRACLSARRPVRLPVPAREAASARRGRLDTASGVGDRLRDARFLAVAVVRAHGDAGQDGDDREDDEDLDQREAGRATAAGNGLTHCHRRDNLPRARQGMASTR